MYQPLLDRLVFAIDLALVLLFIYLVKRILRVDISWQQFFREFRALAKLQITREALNAFSLIITGILLVLVVMGTLASPLEGLAYFLLGIDPKSLPVIPPFAVFGISFGVWVAAMILSFAYCALKR